MNEIAKRQTTEISTQTKNPFTAYAEAASHRNIVGQLLKFSKGDWMYGQDNIDVPFGTQFVANMDELLIGWVRWENGNTTDHIMGKVAEAYQPMSRRELGDEDQSEWEVDESSGRSRDPWQLSNYMVMKGFQSGELFTFATSSKGGRDSIIDLSREYGLVLAQHPDEYPVVEIGTGWYDHPNKAYGRIKTPSFKIVGWVSKDMFVADLGENDEPEEPVEPAPAPKPAPTKPVPVPVPEPAPKPTAPRSVRGRI